MKTSIQMFIAILFIITKLETNQMSLHLWIVKQIVIHPYWRKRHSNFKSEQQTIDLCNHLDGSWGHCAEWKKSNSKAEYCMIPFIQHFWNDKNIEMEKRSVVTKSLEGAWVYKELPQRILLWQRNSSKSWMRLWLCESIHMIKCPRIIHNKNVCMWNWVRSE